MDWAQGALLPADGHPGALGLSFQPHHCRHSGSHLCQWVRRGLRFCLGDGQFTVPLGMAHGFPGPCRLSPAREAAQGLGVFAFCTHTGSGTSEKLAVQLLVVHKSSGGLQWKGQQAAAAGPQI